MYTLTHAIDTSAKHKFGHHYHSSNFLLKQLQITKIMVVFGCISCLTKKSCLGPL